MALFRPELWVQSGFPATYSGTFLVKAYITSDAGASTQVLISRNWSSANEGIVLYWDNSADAMTVAWFTGGGATADFTNFASRPAIGVPFICFLRNTATGVEAGWAYLTNPEAWVLASTATAIPSVGTDNAMNLTSNANGALGVYEGWFGWSDQKTNAQLSLEVYDKAINRTNLIFEHSLNNGDVTSPWVDTSGQGNDATQQGGLAPTDTPNFLALPTGAKIQVGVRTPQVAAGRRASRSLWALDPKNWGSTPLDVAKWFAPELTTAAGGSATVNGQTLTATASLIPGSASGANNATVNGQTLTATTSITAGTVTADSSAAGQTLTATASLIPGSATGTGDASVAGQTLTATASVIPGGTQADGDVVGQTLAAVASLLAGSAFGPVDATVNGQTLTAIASLIPGGAFGPAAGGTVQSNRLALTVGLGV